MKIYNELLEEATDLIYGRRGCLDPFKAEEILNLLNETPELNEEIELKANITSLISLSKELQGFNLVPIAENIEYDNDFKSTYEAAKSGDEIACYRMYIKSIYGDSYELDNELDSMLLEPKMSNFYLLKGSEYGDSDCKYILANNLLTGAFGVRNPKLALNLINQLKESDYIDEVECYEDDIVVIGAYRPYTLDELKEKALVQINKLK